MKEQFTLYGVLNKSTGKLVSNITNPRHKFWEKKGMAERAVEVYKIYYRENMVRKYPHNPDDLEVVEIDCRVK
jgi:hypothetical protein